MGRWGIAEKSQNESTAIFESRKGIPPFTHPLGAICSGLMQPLRSYSTFSASGRLLIRLDLIRAASTTLALLVWWFL
jgi:hypothetical protein